MSKWFPAVHTIHHVIHYWSENHGNQPETAREKWTTKKKDTTNEHKKQGNFDTVVALSSPEVFISVSYLYNYLILHEKDSQEFPKKDSQENIP